MKKGKFSQRTSCRLCGNSDLHMVLDMGWMPLAGNYLHKKDIGTELYYPLQVFFCKNCFSVQLLDIISSKKIFRDYRYLSSVGLTSHFQDYAKEMKQRFLKSDSFVVEIGSNDGVLLQPLHVFGMKVLGVDPAENVARIAQNKGLATIPDFFTKQLR